MARILIVDDDSNLRKALIEVLSKEGHELVEAENGKIARERIALNDFNLVISDFQMPFLDGIELLKWIKSNRPMPVILITGFSHILETQQAFELGADGFLSKPFGYNDIIECINSIVAPPSAQEQPENHDAEYCRIPIEDFVSSNSVQINVYVRLSEHKYIRVAHKGDQLPSDRVDNYKRKGVTYLYARKEDFAKLVEFNLDLSKIVKKTPSISAEKKARFLRYTTELVLEQVSVQGVDKTSYEQAKDCLNLCLDLITESEPLVDLLDVLNSHANWIYAHSLGVSLYSSMISRKMGFKTPSTIFKVSTAGLFHDIGKKEISIDILTKLRPLLTQEERKLYESHATRGKEILEVLKEMSGDVIQIVYEHHEDCLGQGFPRQLPKERIHPLARIVAVANRFCNYALVNPHSTGCDASRAIQKMAHYHGDQLDKAAFNALRELCNEN